MADITPTSFIAAYDEALQATDPGFWPLVSGGELKAIDSLTATIPDIAPTKFVDRSGAISYVSATGRIVSISAVEKNYALSVPLSVKRNDRTGVLDAQIKQAAAKARKIGNALIASTLNSNGVCADGQNLIDTDHSDGSGNVTNALTATEVTALNVTSTSAITLAEADAIVYNAFTYFQGLKDEAGDLANDDMKKVVILTKSNQRAGMYRQAIISAMVGSTNSASYALKNTGVEFYVFQVPTLSAADADFMIRADSAMPAFVVASEYNQVHEGEDVKNSDYWLRHELVIGAVGNNYKSIVRLTLS